MAPRPRRGRAGDDGRGRVRLDGPGRPLARGPCGGAFRERPSRAGAAHDGRASRRAAPRRGTGAPGGHPAALSRHGAVPCPWAGGTSPPTSGR
jgi:hypothetical protein